MGYNEVSGCRYGYSYSFKTSSFSAPTTYVTPVYKENGIIKSYQRVLAGSPVGVLIPQWIGETVIDSTNNDFYIAYGTGSNSQWKKLT